MCRRLLKGNPVVCRIIARHSCRILANTFGIGLLLLMCEMPCRVYTVHCAGVLSAVTVVWGVYYCTLYTCTVHCTLYTVHCTLYTVHCTGVLSAVTVVWGVYFCVLR